MKKRFIYMLADLVLTANEAHTVSVGFPHIHNCG